MTVVKRFEVGPELGARLRELRLAAGLSMVQVAGRMGHPQSYKGVLWRLEKGRLPMVSLGLVLDFLRAVRASVRDIADLVDAYTRREPYSVELVRVRLAEVNHRDTEAEEKGGGE